MINKVLLKPHTEVEEPVQIINLFRTMSKAKHKCCKLIIDNGSTDNMVCIEMMDKLWLKKITHPTPYRVSWLQKRHQVLVNEQCQEEFQIWTFKDQVLCDVMLMDVCHVLLGRSWQFNKKVIYDGRENTFTFEKDGSRHTLLPLKDERSEEQVNPHVLLVGGK